MRKTISWSNSQGERPGKDRYRYEKSIPWMDEELISINGELFAYTIRAERSDDTVIGLDDYVVRVPGGQHFSVPDLRRAGHDVRLPKFTKRC